MLSSLFTKPKIYNQKLHDYCLQSTKDSIRKMIERKEEERKSNSYNINFTSLVSASNSSPSGNPIIPIIFMFISFSTFIYNRYYLKR